MKAPSLSAPVEELSSEMLALMSRFVSEKIGLHFSPQRWSDLQRGLRSAADELGFAGVSAYARSLLNSRLTQRETEILASNLTIGETYFFRESKAFEALEQTILPEIIQARRGKEQRLRIWSAGCSTGEEPYSLAMLLREMLPDLAHWQVTVLATDINPRSLAKAAAGIYGEWSFRDVPPAIKDRYFRKLAANRYELSAEVRRMVSLQYLNFADDSYPSLNTNTSAMDVIFCRNVLMYFGPEEVARVVQNFWRTLMDGGWLIVGASEASQALFSNFTTVSFPGCTAYRKPGPNEHLKRIVHDTESTGSPSIPVPLARLTPANRPIAGPVVASPGLEKSATLEQALEFYGSARYAEAAEVLVALDRAGPLTSEALSLWARISANQGDLTGALKLCDRAVALDKMDARLYYLRSTVQQEQGAVAEALASLKQALYLESDFALAHFAMGNIVRQSGNWADANKHYRNALGALQKATPEETLPESEGLTAGRLTAIITSLLGNSE